MANLFYDENRDIIPHWHNFNTTVILGELNSIQPQEKEIKKKYSIEHYVLEFKKNQTLAHAADLLSASIANGQIRQCDS